MIVSLYNYSTNNGQLLKSLEQLMKSLLGISVIVFVGYRCNPWEYSLSLSVCACVRGCVYTCVRACVLVCVRVCFCVCVSARTRARECTCVFLHMCAYVWPTKWWINRGASECDGSVGE